LLEACSEIWNLNGSFHLLVGLHACLFLCVLYIADASKFSYSVINSRSKICPKIVIP
jgi:hypothetical protein